MMEVSLIMPTVIRSQLATSNPYYISKHRYYELKHYCLQYPEWKRMMSKIREKSLIGGYIVYNNTSIQESDKTGDYGVFLANLSHSMKEIEQICKEAGGDISDWLFAAVTEGISYPILEARGIPCGRDYFYLRYRKFFWLLSQVR